MSLTSYPLILHIPHASDHIPNELYEQFIVSKSELKTEIDLMTDHFTDWLIKPLNAPTTRQIIAPVSRLVVDMERFSDDSQEVMSKVGMGVVYQKGSHRQVIRRQLSSKERKSLIEKYYKPHHDRLEKLTEQMLEQFCNAIIVDVHSYPSITLPYELDATQTRPEICIGTCDFDTPELLAVCLVESFNNKGFVTSLNSPFSGTLIPSKYWQNDSRVIGFMIEVRRDIYMNETRPALIDVSEKIRARICTAILEALEQYTVKNDKYE